MAHSCSGGAQPPFSAWLGRLASLAETSSRGKSSWAPSAEGEPERVAVGRLTGSSGTELGTGWYSRFSLYFPLSHRLFLRFLLSPQG